MTTKTIRARRAKILEEIDAINLSVWPQLSALEAQLKNLEKECPHKNTVVLVRGDLIGPIKSCDDCGAWNVRT